MCLERWEFYKQANENQRDKRKKKESLQENRKQENKSQGEKYQIQFPSAKKSLLNKFQLVIYNIFWFEHQITYFQNTQ